MRKRRPSQELTVLLQGEMMEIDEMTGEMIEGMTVEMIDEMIGEMIGEEDLTGLETIETTAGETTEMIETEGITETEKTVLRIGGPRIGKTRGLLKNKNGASLPK